MDGVELTLMSVEDDVAKFLLVEVNDYRTRNIEMYFDDGLPQGYDTVLYELYFGQKLYSVQPSIGSAGGTKLTISTAAIGADTDLTGWVL